MGRTTLYGAIGNCLTQPVFLTGPSTNKETTIEFLTTVASRLTKRCVSIDLSSNCLTFVLVVEALARV